MADLDGDTVPDLVPPRCTWTSWTRCFGGSYTWRTRNQVVAAVLLGAQPVLLLGAGLRYCSPLATSPPPRALCANAAKVTGPPSSPVTSTPRRHESSALQRRGNLSGGIAPGPWR